MRPNTIALDPKIEGHVDSYRVSSCHSRQEVLGRSFGICLAIFRSPLLLSLSACKFWKNTVCKAPLDKRSYSAKTAEEPYFRPIKFASPIRPASKMNPRRRKP